MGRPPIKRLPALNKVNLNQEFWLKILSFGAVRAIVPLGQCRGGVPQGTISARAIKGLNYHLETSAEVVSMRHAAEM